MGKQKTLLPVEWDTNEKERFKELLKDIKKRSENLAQRIKDRVKDNLNQIQQNPKMFEADPLRIDSDDSFRKFTAIQIRIVYKIDPDKVIIVRVRHAASEPSEY